MAEPFNAIFGKPFPEQIAALRFRLEDLVPTERWDDLVRDAHDRSFVVAGAMKADLLADLAEAVQRSIEEGGTLEQFRSDFRDIVKRNGWHGWTGEGTKKGEAWRTKVIYKTNAATSYAAGRMAQLVEAGFKYWIYRHGGSEHPRLHHLELDGLVLRADHPFWLTYGPPNGWGCSCYILGANSMKAARLLGGDPSKTLPENWQDIDPKTGEMRGIGKGWGYSPGLSVARSVGLASKKIASLPANIGSAYGFALAQLIERAWSEWVKDVVEEKTRQSALLGVYGRGELRVFGKINKFPPSAELVVKPSLLNGPKAKRHALAGDALSVEEWVSLPSLIRGAKRVFHDLSSGNLIYVLKVDERLLQVTVRPNFILKGERGHGRSNMVVSAYSVKERTLLSRLKAGQLKLLVEE